MFTTILVGVDDRQGGRDALALAQSLSDLGGGDLLAVHVYPYEPFPTLALPSDVDVLAREGAERRIRAQLADAGIDARIEVRAGTSPVAACTAMSKRPMPMSWLSAARTPGHSVALSRVTTLGRFFKARASRWSSRVPRETNARWTGLRRWVRRLT